MTKLIATLFAAFFALASASAAPDFAVGQKWSIKDSGMTIVIGRIEPFDGGHTAVSVSVFGLPCPPDSGCTTTTISHVPIDSAALADSVDKLLATGAATDEQFEAGYANWKSANGGIFTVPVSQLPDLFAKSLSPNTQLKNE